MPHKSLSRKRSTPRVPTALPSTILKVTEFLAGMKVHTGTPTPDYTDNMCSDAYAQSLLQENGRVTMAYTNLSIMPTKIPRLIGDKVEDIDLGHNRFKDLGFLANFSKLHTLVLDWNTELKVETFPAVPTLKILWLNHCNIADIEEWVGMLSAHCPDLEHLSMLCNPGACTELNGKTEDEERKYRENIIQKFTNLKTLDGRPVENEQKNSSLLTESFPSISNNCLTNLWESLTGIVAKKGKGKLTKIERRNSANLTSSQE